MFHDNEHYDSQINMRNDIESKMRSNSPESNMCIMFRIIRHDIFNWENKK